MKILLITFLVVCGIMNLWPEHTSAESAVEPAVRAAMSIWGYINSADIQTGKCREIDSANAASYDRVYATYHQDLGDTIVRIDFLLTEEATRLGAKPDFFTSRLPRFSDIAAREAKRMAETNPGLFLAMCRSLPKAATDRTDVCSTPAR
jgi:hypothetical protein